MKKERHARIIEIMQNQNIITIKDLAQQLNCTEMTVRRNLDELQNMNFVKRERGYAILLQPAKDTDYYVESGEHEREKRAIATIALYPSIPEYLYGFRNYNPATYHNAPYDHAIISDNSQPCRRAGIIR